MKRISFVLATIIAIISPLLFVGTAFAAPAVSINIVDDSYAPQNITVPVGTTVVWVNNGSMTHTVSADNGSFDSGAIIRGNTYNHIFTQTGTYRYYCRFHGAPNGVGMSGTITVVGAVAGAITPSASPASSSGQGTPVVPRSTPTTGASGISAAVFALLFMSGAAVFIELFRRRNLSPHV